jgi:NAD-dependent dihydropyrimidine dehydrogenase PreA subunit
MNNEANPQLLGKKSWHGVDRMNLEWYPSIDEEACTGCSLCIISGGNSVFKWNLLDGKPRVAVPQNCVLGCTTCGKVCPEDAITFPSDPSTFIKSVAIRYKIYPRVKEELEDRLRKFPDHVVGKGGGGSCDTRIC